MLYCKGPYHWVGVSRDIRDTRWRVCGRGWGGGWIEGGGGGGNIG